MSGRNRKETILLMVLLLVLFLSWNVLSFGEFYAIPVLKSCTCKGTLNGTRWCDNGDGTVTDLTTCLVWLKKANWGEAKKWEDCTDHDDAHTRAGILHAGSAGANLTDNSIEGDWRLPRKTELYNLANGTEAVRSGTMRAFTGVETDHSFYWSSTTYANDTSQAWCVTLDGGLCGIGRKILPYYVWPVRDGQ